MPVVDVVENINQLRTEIDNKSKEILRLQGMIEIFDGFRKGGLTKIELPNDPNDPNQPPVEELESIQEKPE
jgi:hypothetical protein